MLLQLIKIITKIFQPSSCLASPHPISPFLPLSLHYRTATQLHHALRPTIVILPSNPILLPSPHPLTLIPPPSIRHSAILSPSFRYHSVFRPRWTSKSSFTSTQVLLCVHLERHECLIFMTLYYTSQESAYQRKQFDISFRNVYIQSLD